MSLRDRDLDTPFNRQVAYGKVNGDQPEPSRAKKCAYLTLALLIGAGLAIIGVVIYNKVHHSGGGSDSPSSASWKASDYEENWQYYDKIAAHPIGVTDNMRLSRIGAPVVSPDESMVAFTRTQYDQTAQNRSATSIWVYRLPYTDGFSALPVTRPIWGVHDSQLQFDSYSRSLFFLSNRVSGDDKAAGSDSQIFQVSVAHPNSVNEREHERVLTAKAKRASLQQRVADNKPIEGDDAPTSLPTPANSVYTSVKQLTHFPLPVDNLLLGRTTDKAQSTFAFSVRVFPGMSMQATVDRLKTIRERGGNFMLYDKLFVRHWDEWHDGTRNHVHLMGVTQAADSTVRSLTDTVDIMGAVDADAPTRPDGSPDSEWAFSKTGANFAFVRQTWDAYSNVSWTDNTDVYTVKLSTGAGGADPFSVQLPAVCRTCANLAIDTAPAYSPVSDDTFAYLSTRVMGYESDRKSVKLLDGADVITELTGDWTHSVDSLAWAASGSGLYVGVARDARSTVEFLDVTTKASTGIPTPAGSASGAQPIANGSLIIYSWSSTQAPSTIIVQKPDGSGAADLTAGFNAAALSKMQLSATEQFRFGGSVNGSSVQSFFFKPVGGFVPGKKYPFVYLIHGGPQSAWLDQWSFRWNPQVWAAAGFAVAMVNFHGSNSFGQEFTDSITGNYGTLPYQDLMLGLDFFLNDLPYAANLDPERIAAAGASYGGFMINWIAGHNVDQKYKFKALVCHDGMFDVNAFYYQTEELWFVEHDMQGVAYEVPNNYAQFNPARADLISKWNTPMMIIHGGRDYRIDEAQGLGAFTALQRRGVPSKFLYFPNEAHQVFNTQNQIEWHNQVIGWIQQYTS